MSDFQGQAIAANVHLKSSKLYRTLIWAALLSVFGCATQAAVTEGPAPQVQSSSPLVAAPVPSRKPAWLTPEKEAALVEVRTILREAKQAAEAYTLPSKLTTSSEMYRAKEERKIRLLEQIEKVQLRAGDLSAGRDTKRPYLLALAQAQYGDSSAAVETAAQLYLADNQLLLLVDTLIQSGDLRAAAMVAGGSFAKQGVPLWRQRNEAAVYALIARRQHEARDPEAAAMLQKAINAVPEPTHTPDRYLALLHVARTQAIMGDRAGSDVSFRKAIDAALDVRGKGVRGGGLIWVAKAQAEVGAKAASEQTFKHAVELGQTDEEPSAQNIHLGCLAWAQSVSGQKNAIEKTFRIALENVGHVELTKRGQVLAEIARWQLEAGDVSGARETAMLILRWAESLSDPAAKSTAMTSAAGLTLRAGNAKRALELAAQVTNNMERAGLLTSIARTLLTTHDPFGSPEIFQQLADEAAVLLEHPEPRDRSKRDSLHSFITLVQAAAGDVPMALRTADAIGFLSTRIQSYGRVANLLTVKGDFVHAKQVIQAMEEQDWLLREGMAVVRTFTRIRTTSDHAAAALAWARQEKSLYIKAEGLFGVALGLMQQQGMQDADRLLPEIPMRDSCGTVKDAPLY